MNIALGEHGEEILIELGYDAQKIDEFKGAGVVNSPKKKQDFD